MADYSALDSAVLSAARDGRFDALVDALRKGGHPKARDEMNRTPLMLAHQNSHHVCVKLLKWPPACLAVLVKRGDGALLRRLCEEKADVNAMVRTHNEPDEIRALWGDNWLVPDTGREWVTTPLALAVSRRDFDVVQTLLAANANVDVVTKVRESASPEMPPKNTQWTALLLACSTANYEIIRALLDAKANASLPGPLNALKCCIDRRLDDVATLLMDHGANLQSATQASSGDEIVLMDGGGILKSINGVWPVPEWAVQYQRQLANCQMACRAVGRIFTRRKYKDLVPQMVALIWATRASELWAGSGPTTTKRHRTRG